MVANPLFKSMDEICDDLYELSQSPKKISWKDPIQIGVMVYNNAKLHMLKFFYDCLKKYINDRDIEFLFCDTDSLYYALSGPLFDVIKPHLRDEFFYDYHKWFVSPACEVHRDEFAQNPKGFDASRPCCKTSYLHNKREPGLCKPEYFGKGFVGLNSKTYFCHGEQSKFACKGVSKTNALNFEIYRDVLESQQSFTASNRGFYV